MTRRKKKKILQNYYKYHDNNPGVFTGFLHFDVLQAQDLLFCTNKPNEVRDLLLCAHPDFIDYEEIFDQIKSDLRLYSYRKTLNYSNVMESIIILFLKFVKLKDVDKIKELVDLLNSYLSIIVMDGADENNKELEYHFANTNIRTVSTLNGIDFIRCYKSNLRVKPYGIDGEDDNEYMMDYECARLLSSRINFIKEYDLSQLNLPKDFIKFDKSINVHVNNEPPSCETRSRDYELVRRMVVGDIARVTCIEDLYAIEEEIMEREPHYTFSFTLY